MLPTCRTPEDIYQLPRFDVSAHEVAGIPRRTPGIACGLPGRLWAERAVGPFLALYGGAVQHARTQVD